MHKCRIYTTILTIKDDGMKKIKYYQSQTGKEPFKEWLQSVRDSVGVAQINNRVRRLSLGQRGDSEPVGEGVFELRIHFGPGYRVYYAELEQKLVILLLGGHKGTQKRDIARAKEYWKDYKRQYDDEKN